MKLRESTIEDIEYVAERTASRGIHKDMPGQIDYFYTLEHEGRPLGIGAFKLINLFTAWCWLDTTKESRKHTPAVYRIMSEWMGIFTEEHGIKRLQAYVECDFPEAIRLVEHLGFKKESTMKKFMGDKDAFMFARTI